MTIVAYLLGRWDWIRGRRRGERRSFRGAALDAYQRGLTDQALTDMHRRFRGYVTLEATVLVVTLGLVFSIVLFACVGVVFGQRDAARKGEAAATKRADACAVDLARLDHKAQQLEERVRLHLAIDDDRCPCVCGDPQ